MLYNKEITKIQRFKSTQVYHTKTSLQFIFKHGTGSESFSMSLNNINILFKGLQVSAFCLIQKTFTKTRNNDIMKTA